MAIWDFLQVYGVQIARGTLVTCAQFLTATMVALVVALFVGLGKLSTNALIRGVSVIYIELFRGTSLLVQVFWIFFVLPLFGLTLSPFTAGFLSVGLNIGAYGAELVRGAIQSIPRGQWEAATAISLSPARRMRRIILPQAFSIMLPPWGNLLIELLKSTAIVSLISVKDLMFQAKQVNSLAYIPIQAFGIALIIYYILARAAITPLVRWLEHSMAQRQGRV
ncbi:ectoine/hydroxyectoine ABC transporter permease subunit EhuC [Mesorhizobium sp. VK25A]|uniref:Ectoine/hydroxyectoine ABC transporter permease subunit EhuC n=1 Tax=Mesorhizobium vachelliae TaxID=3072309 RepID=A0ABU5AF31_9HYPH|nr:MULTISPECIES: ectoine/hydroxyectoine ABC transporter permease subunit EhuC [unclassified Mesorhizobium]MDX8535880.1 ectoine/hydroxyectoine ABC transporter permease subunit EhuC [Mesorhizobium sp. VK25D]MDX8548630.1 ectoine/hydroxyectoine ABC transporter permease subunit EhuC [Mesorhizobium sp. VK25A]